MVVMIARSRPLALAAVVVSSLSWSSALGAEPKANPATARVRAIPSIAFRVNRSPSRGQLTAATSAGCTLTNRTELATEV